MDKEIKQLENEISDLQVKLLEKRKALQELKISKIVRHYENEISYLYNN